jgi:UDP-N-acetylmuramoylalanine--D-glutamate ligase
MKIAIAGYGTEGKVNYQYWNKPENQITIIDEKDTIDDLPDYVDTRLGKDVLQKLGDFDLVIRTAGISPRKIKTNGKIWSATNEFFEKCPAPIIGVTGSKGKGTTCSLITSILRAAGRTVHLVGNIGMPGLSILPKITKDDIIVYELSSFQLQDLEKSPHVAVILMVEPDHLDVHTDLNEYLMAKTNIYKHQSTDDICFYHSTNTYVKQILSLTNQDLQQSSHRLPYNTANELSNDIWIALSDNHDFYASKKGVENIKICSVNELKLPGAHNIENTTAAISAALVFIKDWSAVVKGLSEFTGLPHRLKLIREVDGVKYYDDSIATTPGSAIAAIKAFSQPKVLILGGSDKGAHYDELADEIARNDSMKKVVAVGSNGAHIAKLIKERGVNFVEIESSKSMEDIVKRTQAYTQDGDVVILSPAAASFDMFKSYADRGDKFIAAIQSL